MGVRLPSLVGSGSVPRVRGSGLPEVEEALDIHGDAMAEVARHVAQGAKIRDVGRYAEQVAYRAFCASLRTKHQTRYQTRLRIQHVLSGRANVTGLAMWTGDHGEARLCGFRQWRDDGNSRDCTASLLRQGLGDGWRRAFIEHALRGRDPQEVTLDRLLAAIFDFVGGPVEVESLVLAVACLRLNTEPRRAVSLARDDQAEDTPLALSPEDVAETGARGPLERAIDRDTLVWAGSEIPQLPDKQRLAVLLPLESDLLRMLAGIARMKRVCDMLGCDQTEARVLLEGMPFDDNRIAGRLGISRQQVINLRSAARSRLFRRFTLTGGGEDEPV